MIVDNSKIFFSLDKYFVLLLCLKCDRISPLDKTRQQKMLFL